jgi:hypothetical protein
VGAVAVPAPRPGGAVRVVMTAGALPRPTTGGVRRSDAGARPTVGPAALEPPPVPLPFEPLALEPAPLDPAPFEPMPFDELTGAFGGVAVPVAFFSVLLSVVTAGLSPGTTARPTAVRSTDDSEPAPSSFSASGSFGSIEVPVVPDFACVSAIN